MSSKGRIKIKVYLSGGLGNQLFQASAGRKLAFPQETILLPNLGQAILSEDHSPEISDFNLEELAIQIDQREFSDLQIYLARKILMLSSVSSTSLLKNLLVSALKKVNEFLLGILIDERIQSPKGVGFDPTFQLRPNTTLLIGNFHSHFWVDDSFKELLSLKTIRSNSYAQLNSQAKFESPLGIHVRLGDYLEIDELNVLTAQYYLNAFNDYRMQAATGPIWIFTNDSSKLNQYLPAELICGAKIVDSNLSSSETFELMRNCSTLVIANSTFSWWAAYSKHLREAPTFTPNRWFRNAPNPIEITPKAWIPIDHE